MVNVFIEVEAGSCNRHKFNEKTLEHLGVRTEPLPYPYPYGFIIGTSADDGCCVDCYVITKSRLEPGTIVACEPAGLMEQYEGEEIDHKVLAVIPEQEMELGPKLLEELQEFIYAIFDTLPEAAVRVEGIVPKEAALRYLEAQQSAL